MARSLYRRRTSSSVAFNGAAVLNTLPAGRHGRRRKAVGCQHSMPRWCIALDAMHSASADAAAALSLRGDGSPYIPGAMLGWASARSLMLRIPSNSSCTGAGALCCCWASTLLVARAAIHSHTQSTYTLVRVVVMCQGPAGHGLWPAHSSGVWLHLRKTVVCGCMHQLRHLTASASAPLLLAAAELAAAGLSRCAASSCKQAGPTASI